MARPEIGHAVYLCPLPMVDKIDYYFLCNIGDAGYLTIFQNEWAPGQTPLA